MQNNDFSLALKHEYISLRVVPNAQKTEIKELMGDGETWKIRVKAAPEKGKANAEILRFLKKEYRVEAEIISGKTDSRKLLKIISFR